MGIEGTAAARSAFEIAFDAPPDVRDALAAMARTEDVRLSPNGKRLAIACFARERIAVAGVEINASPTGPEIAVTSLEELESTAIRQPHGVDWVDDETLAVASRGCGLAVFRLPPARAAGRTTRIGPVNGEPAGALDGPGSVAARPLGPGYHEVLACNNHASTVTRHALGATGALTEGEVVLRKWLDIPDGLAISHDGCWLAVSNHNTHSVFLYALSALVEEADPVGTLRGVNYPHGVQFGPGDDCLVVADAGAPYVHVFLPNGDGWEGVDYPAATIRVMDDDTFARGRHNPREGGPKGIDVDPRSNVLVATAECLPLGFFDLAAALEQGENGRPEDALVRYELAVLAETGSMKATATAETAAAAEARALLAEAESTSATAAAEASALRAEIERLIAESEHLRAVATDANAQLEALLRSKSLRLTEPARRAVWAARRVKQRLRGLDASADEAS